MRTFLCFSMMVLLPLGTATLARGVEIQFDFMHDIDGFFGDGTAARGTLEAAGLFYSELLSDDLDAIIPGPSGFGFPNTWDASYTNPYTGNEVSITDMSVPADTLIVFVGRHDLPGNRIGMGGPGGFDVSGTSEFLDRVQGRGEGVTTGSSAVDFGRWGGSLALDNSTNWNLSHTSEPARGETDLFSAILHEMAHVLGFGTSESFRGMINVYNEFAGSAAVRQFGGPIPLAGSTGHWVTSTMSTVYPEGVIQETAMDPSLNAGARKLMTDLDVAALDDLGWDITPPTSTLPAIQPGDANRDRSFDTQDIVLVLAAAKFEQDLPATWAEGDWNGAPNSAYLYGGAPPPGDGRFNTLDIIAALGGGTFETGAIAAVSASSTASEVLGELTSVPEPRSCLLLTIGAAAIMGSLGSSRPGRRGVGRW